MPVDLAAMGFCSTATISRAKFKFQAEEGLLPTGIWNRKPSAFGSHLVIPSFNLQYPK
ncbi:hypothetical protein E4U34_007365, partial [Claviceps purpurea]